MNKFLLLCIALIVVCQCQSPDSTESKNPIFVELNQPIDFAAITADHIIESYDQIVEQTGQNISTMVDVSEEQKTWDNTMLKLDDMIDEFSSAFGIIYLMGSTHPDSAIRNTAIEKRTELAKLYNEISLNEDLYNAVKAYSLSEEAQNLQGYKLKFLTETVKEFERNGFALPLEKREELKVILNELSEIGNEFNSNIAAYKDHLILTEKDMEGMNEDYKKSHLQEDGSYKIGMSYPDVTPFMKYASSSAARKQLSFKYSNRAADKNLDVLVRMIKKRQEMASLLGYNSFADYQTETRMVGGKDAVWAFEKDLVEQVMPKAKVDMAELVKFMNDSGIKGNKVNSWDRSNLTDKMLSQNYGVDSELIKEYFELSNVKDGLFKITQELFGLKYEPMKDPSVWHPDVDAYEVFQDGKLVGRFYLDLHPRDNKYNHAACFPIISSKQMKPEYQRPAASLVCNFTEPTEDKPALMSHGEVVTFFHEFGHVLHHLLSKTDLGSQAGFSVAQDFVEAPSQIFENWAWNYDALSLFARHYETDQVLPVGLFNKMNAAKNVMSGIYALRQIHYGTYDLTLYDSFDPEGQKSTTDVWFDLFEKTTLFEPLEGTHPEAAFGHLNGYAASYYGYLWSEVYAQDMFSRFEDEGILNPEVGKAYRDKILSRGSTMTEMDMLKDFLGREPNNEAFVKSLGL